MQRTQRILPQPRHPFVGLLRLAIAIVLTATVAMADANLPQAPSAHPQTHETTKVARFLEATKHPIRWVKTTGKRQLATIAKLARRRSPQNTFVAQSEVNRLVELKQLPAETPQPSTNPAQSPAASLRTRQDSFERRQQT